VQREFNIQAQPCFLLLSGKYSSSSHVSNIEIGLDHLLHTKKFDYSPQSRCALANF
jgi:hypothetical protein